MHQEPEQLQYASGGEFSHHLQNSGTSAANPKNNRAADLQEDNQHRRGVHRGLQEPSMDNQLPFDHTHRSIFIQVQRTKDTKRTGADSGFLLSTSPEAQLYEKH